MKGWYTGTLAVALSIVVCSLPACDAVQSGGGTAGDDTSSGGTSSGGTSSGGTSSGGTSSGGTSSGGTSSGGTSSGGTSSGGTSSGGTSSGGISSGGTSSGGHAGGAVPSAGCGALSTRLKNNPPGNGGSASTVNKITVGGREREFLVRWPSDYKKDTPYRLILGLHGHGGSWQESGLTNYGLWNLSRGSTIFVALSAIGGNWDGPTDLIYADEVLKLVESELCIDTSRVMLEGFSQGAGMSWYLTCSRPGVFRAVAGHSGGGVGGVPSTCSNVAYLGSLGLNDVPGNSQATQTDRFARANGCTIDQLPTAQPRTHVCTSYSGCKTGFPVTWCSFDGGHDYQPVDPGASSTWMPQAVWDFLSPL